MPTAVSKDKKSAVPNKKSEKAAAAEAKETENDSNGDVGKAANKENSASEGDGEAAAPAKRKSDEVVDLTDAKEAKDSAPQETDTESKSTSPAPKKGSAGKSATPDAKKRKTTNGKDAEAKKTPQAAPQNPMNHNMPMNAQVMNAHMMMNPQVMLMNMMQNNPHLQMVLQNNPQMFMMLQSNPQLIMMLQTNPPMAMAMLQNQMAQQNQMMMMRRLQHLNVMEQSMAQVAEQAKIPEGTVVNLKLPLGEKLGIFLDDNKDWDMVELRMVKADSPIRDQIPKRLQKDSFIVSMESEAIGKVKPKTAKECVELIAICKTGKSSPVDMKMTLVKRRKGEKPPSQAAPPVNPHLSSPGKQIFVNNDGYLCLRIILTLPAGTKRIGMLLDDNASRGMPELKGLSPDSPIRPQIPPQFHKDCTIAWLKSEAFGHVMQPKLAKECAELVSKLLEVGKTRLVNVEVLLIQTAKHQSDPEVEYIGTTPAKAPASASKPQKSAQSKKDFEEWYNSNIDGKDEIAEMKIDEEDAAQKSKPADPFWKSAEAAKLFGFSQGDDILKGLQERIKLLKKANESADGWKALLAPNDGSGDEFSDDDILKLRHKAQFLIQAYLFAMKHLNKYSWDQCCALAAKTLNDLGHTPTEADEIKVFNDTFQKDNAAQPPVAAESSKGQESGKQSGDGVDGEDKESGDKAAGADEEGKESGDGAGEEGKESVTEAGLDDKGKESDDEAGAADEEKEPSAAQKAKETGKKADAKSKKASDKTGGKAQKGKDSGGEDSDADDKGEKSGDETAVDDEVKKPDTGKQVRKSRRRETPRRESPRRESPRRELPRRGTRSSARRS